MAVSACADQGSVTPLETAPAASAPEGGFFEIQATPPPALTPIPTETPAPTPEYDMKELSKKGYVLGHEVNLRGGPGLTYPIVDVVAYHAIIKVTGESGDWYRIDAGGTEGFMLKNFVGLGGIPTPAPTPKPTKKPTPKPSGKPAKTTPKPTATPKPSIRQGEPGSYSDAEITLAAQLIYAEGRGQGMDGYIAMANVLYNRTRSSRFDGSIEDVIFRPGQFSVADDREEFLTIKPNSSALSAAKQVFNDGLRVLPSNVMYFRSARSSKSWGKRTYYATIGGNHYYS